MPIASASAMPIAKDRKEIETAVLNFAVGRIVIPAASTAEKGGTIVESFAAADQFPNDEPDRQRKKDRNFLTEQSHIKSLPGLFMER